MGFTRLLSFIYFSICFGVTTSFKQIADREGILIWEARELQAGNWTVFQLAWSGPIRAVVETVKGDADLYLSYSSANVSFFMDKHNTSSTTCGIDLLDVPRLGPFSARPAYLGIYAHPSAPYTIYNLLLLNLNNDTDVLPDYNEIKEIINESSPVSDDLHGWKKSIYRLLGIVFEIFLEILHALLDG